MGGGLTKEVNRPRRRLGVQEEKRNPTEGRIHLAIAGGVRVERRVRPDQAAHILNR